VAGFIEELRKRRVVRAGIAYAVAGFVVLQAADLILNGLGAPPIAFKVLIIVVLLGFPLVLGLAWAFDLTPDGVQRAVGEKGSAARGVALVIVGMVIAFAAFAAYGGLSAKEDERERIESIGVLPFVNLSDDRGNEYFSDGMTEELLNVLAKVPGLQVASRTSSFQFKGKSIDVGDAAAKLGVRSILEGSVRHRATAYA
jgi:adenylate cyclase